MNRAYSILDVKSIEDEKRIIRGMATTPSPDRVGDIVDPLGVSFKNPLPLLWQHKSDSPVGLVTFDKPTKKGVTFEAHLPVIEASGALKDRVDEAWQSVKAGLVRGVSIGFRVIENGLEVMKDGGLRFLATEVLELSLVTIPANADCSIQTIKSIDADLLAASGRTQESEPTPPAPREKSTPTRRNGKMTIQEQIAAWEAKRAASMARMTELMTKSAEAGSTLDDDESEEYDGLDVEVKKIDEHLTRFKSLEQANIKAATPPPATPGAPTPPATRPAGSISVKANVPPGTAFTRMVWCKVNADLNRQNPADVAKAQPWHDQTPEVEMYLRAPVAAGTTTSATWAGPLVEDTNLVSEFAEILRPATIIGRIPGLTRVPFNIKIPREVTAASVGWVGEGAVKPVSAMAFDQITLAFNKVAGIVPITVELFRFSNPGVDAIIRNSLITSIAYLLDRDFLDPTKAAVTGVSPASITNGVTPVTATGATADALRANLATLLGLYITNNMSIGSLVLVMSATQAMNIALMRNTLGQREFEGLGRDGGTLEGIPVIISENIVATGGSPADGSLIVAINAREILLADDGGVDIDMSREASLQMNTAPDSPETASTIMVSLWQRNMIALKAERFITWAKRRDGAVQFIQNAKYTP